ALAADTDAEARQLLKTREQWRVGFEKGIRNSLVSPQEADAQAYTADDMTRIQALRAKAFVGTADAVATRLRAEATRLGLDELVIVTWTFDALARQHSYRLLAQAFGLAPGAG
ncbi:MAG: LLM class flavin-dependent oxidoreductase, partial [Casimicrobiaceae bacterium]